MESTLAGKTSCPWWRTCRSRNRGESQVVRVHARTGKSAHPTNRHIPVAWALLPERDGLPVFMQFPSKRGADGRARAALTRRVSICMPLIQQAVHHAGHACRHAARQHSAKHRPHPKLSQIASSLRSQWSDAADLNSNCTEVGKTTQRVS